MFGCLRGPDLQAAADPGQLPERGHLSGDQDVLPLGQEVGPVLHQRQEAGPRSQVPGVL